MVVLGALSPGGQWTCRRCWARWEGNITGGAKIGIGTQYNTYGATCENCLVTWSGESMPENYTATGPSNLPPNGQAFTNFTTAGTGALVSQDRGDNPTCPNIRVSGSFVYLKASARWNESGGLVYGDSYSDCTTFEHTYVYIDPNHPAFNSVY